MADEGLILNLKSKAKELRESIITMIYNAQSGHPGGSLSAIDFLVALYYHKLKVLLYLFQDQIDLIVHALGHNTPPLPQTVLIKWVMINQRTHFQHC